MDNRPVRDSILQQKTLAASKNSALPPLVLCAGLPSSASTWAFNIVRALLQLSSPNVAFTSFYSDAIDEQQDALLQSVSAAAVKTHGASHSLVMLARMARLPVVMTIRDPRDGVASLMQRFEMSFEAACTLVMNGAAAMTRLKNQCEPLLLRYEDCFTVGTSGIQSIADYLGIDVCAQLIGELSSEHLPPAVGALIERLQSEGVFDGTQPGAQWDSVTLWHPRHVGDGRVDKFHHVLSPSQIAFVEYSAREYMGLFGYAAVEWPIASGTSLTFGNTGIGPAYVTDGFCAIEHWGMWTCASVAEVKLTLRHCPVDWLVLQSDWLLGPALRSSGGAAVDIEIAGRLMTRVDADPTAPERLRLVFSVPASALPADGHVKLTLRFQGLRSPAEVNPGSGDGRTLGLGLVSLKIDYS